jgi:hypothetical protein
MAELVTLAKPDVASAVSHHACGRRREKRPARQKRASLRKLRTERKKGDRSKSLRSPFTQLVGASRALNARFAFAHAAAFDSST